MKKNVLDDFILSLAEEYNIGFNSGHKNRIEGLDKYLSELTSLQNSIDLRKLKNKILFERFRIKYPQFFELIKSNKKYKNIHDGERCFIMGNGPSLKTQDLSYLKDEYLFTVNHIYKYEKFQDLKSNYHFYADSKCFINESYSGNELIKAMKTAYSKNNTVCFLPTLGYDFVNANNLTSYANIEFFSSPILFYDGYDEEIDYSCPTPLFYTVIQWCIAMAIYMGFKEIYLLGCDCDSIIGFVDCDRQIHVYNKDEFEAKNMKYVVDVSGLEIFFRQTADVFCHYAQLYKYCTKRGISLINCTKKTILDNVPRMKYEDIITTKHHCSVKEA